VVVVLVVQDFQLIPVLFLEMADQDYILISAEHQLLMQEVGAEALGRDQILLVELAAEALVAEQRGVQLDLPIQEVVVGLEDTQLQTAEEPVVVVLLLSNTNVHLVNLLQHQMLP